MSQEADNIILNSLTGGQLPVKVLLDGTEWVLFYNENNERVERFILDGVEIKTNKATTFAILNDVKYPTTKAVDDFINIQKGTTIATLDGSGKLTPSQIPDVAVTDVIVAIETNITDFAANSGNYTFEQGDYILIDDNGNVIHYLFVGGDKLDVNEYSPISATQVTISQVIGLQAELDNKVSKLGDIMTGDLTAPNFIGNWNGETKAQLLSNVAYTDIDNDFTATQTIKGSSSGVSGFTKEVDFPLGSGGWARTFLNLINTSDVLGGKFNIGVLGDSNTYRYVYIGFGSHNSQNNLRIYKDKLTVGNNEIYHEGNLDVDELATKTWVRESVQGVGYKVYSVKISQSGVNDPMVSVLLRNELPGSFNWSRSVTGIYTLIASVDNIFLPEKTVVIISSPNAAGGGEKKHVRWFPVGNTGLNNRVQISTHDTSTQVLKDDGLDNTFMEVRVYD